MPDPNPSIEAFNQSKLDAKTQLAALKNQIEATKELPPVAGELDAQKLERLKGKVGSLKGNIDTKIAALKEKFPSATIQLEALRAALDAQANSIYSKTKIGEMLTALNALANDAKKNDTDLSKKFGEVEAAIDVAKPSAAPAGKKQETVEEEVEEGRVAGAINMVKNGFEQAKEAIQSLGASLLEQIADLLKMFGMTKWANSILEYVKGSDGMQLDKALGANGVKMIDPAKKEDASPAEVKQFKTDRQTLYDTFGTVTKYTKQQYYDAVVKAWKAKPENVGKADVTPKELLEIARNPTAIARENPTPTPEQQKEAEAKLVELPPGGKNLMETQQIKVNGKVLNMKMLPDGVEVEGQKQYVIKENISLVEKGLLAGMIKGKGGKSDTAKVNIKSVQRTSEDIDFTYSIIFDLEKGGLGEIDQKPAKFTDDESKKLVKGIADGAKTIEIKKVKFERIAPTV